MTCYFGILGGSAFSNLMYAVELQEFGSVSNDGIIVRTNDNRVNFTELQPTTPYSVIIAPIILGAMVDPLVYCAQTLGNGEHDEIMMMSSHNGNHFTVTDEASIIIATDTGIVTKSIDGQSLASVVINDTNTTGQFLHICTCKAYIWVLVHVHKTEYLKLGYLYK